MYAYVKFLPMSALINGVVRDFSKTAPPDPVIFKLFTPKVTSLAFEENNTVLLGSLIVNSFPRHSNRF